MTDSASAPGIVTGLFADRLSSECAYQAAIRRGYEDSQISVMMSDETRDRYFPTEDRAGRTELEAAERDENAAEASELGGPIGGTIGTIAPVLAAGTLLLIPGFAIAGPIAIALTAAGAVGIAGGLIGALAHWGIPKGRIRQYETGIREGGILIGVKPRSADDAAHLEQQWKTCGGRLVHS